MNAYSIIHNYGEPTYSPDFNFINAALSSKQTALNNNRQKLNNAYDQFAALQVRKDVDQEYIEERLQKIIGLNSQYHTMDLSDDNFASQVLGNVTQLLDDKTKNAIYSTQKMAAEDKVWEEAKKDPKANYAEINERYAKARSDRGRYLSSEVTGDKYQGGADFIKYVDVEAKVNKVLKDAPEGLKETFKKYVQNGMFRSIETYETIEGQKIKDIIEATLSPEDMQQLNINAWDKYKNITDEGLKETYDGFIGSKIEIFDERLSSLKVLLASANTQEDKELIQKRIDEGAKIKKSYEDNKFDNVVGSIGKEGVYNQLYRTEFLQKFADAYDMEENLIDVELDQAHAKEIEYNQKERHFNIEQDLANKKYLLDLSKEQRAVAKELQTEVGVRYGDERDDISYEQNMKDPIFQVQKDYNDAKIGFRDILGYNVPSDQYPLLVKEFGKLKIGETLQVDGKKIEVTEDNFLALNNFKINVLEGSPESKKIRSTMQSMANSTLQNIRKLVQNPNPSWNKYDLMRPTWRYQEKDGKLVKVPIEKQNHNHFVYLLEKPEETLTKAEKATLKAYNYTMMVHNAESLGMTKAQKQAMYETMRYDLIAGGVSSKTFLQMFPLDLDSKIISIFKQPLVTIKSSSEGISANTLFTMDTARDSRYHNIQSWDAEYTGTNGRDVAVSHPKKIVKNRLAVLQEEIAKSWESKNMESTYRNPLVNDKSPGYANLKSILMQRGYVTPDFKGEIEISPQFNEKGELTGKSSLKTTVKGKSYSILPVVAEDIDNSILQSYGYSVAPMKRYKYDAKTFGTDAPSLILGTGAKQNVKLASDPVILNRDEFLRRAEESGATEEVKNLISDYYNSKLFFEMVGGSDGQYYTKISGGSLGKNSAMLPTDVDVLTDESVIDISKQADLSISASMQELLNNIIEIKKFQ